MDIDAIALLSEQKDEVVKIMERSDEEILNDIRTLAKSTTETTTECISQVNDYSVNIKKAMEELKGQVKEYHIRIGDVMKEFSKSMFRDVHNDVVQGTGSSGSSGSHGHRPTESHGPGHRSDVHVTGKVSETNTAKMIGSKNLGHEGGSLSSGQRQQNNQAQTIPKVKRDYFDTLRANQLRELQNLAKQQNELLQLMSETMMVINTIEEEGEISLASLEKLQRNVNHYAETIKKEEKRFEKKKLENEQAKRKAEERRRSAQQRQREKEQQERQKKERERKKREEEELRKDEKKRRDEEEQKNKEKRRRKNEEEKKRKEEDERYKENRKREKEEREREEEENRKEWRRQEEERRRKEEKRREQEEQKRKEEESKRKEEESKRKEEERKKLEEETKRKQQEEEERKRKEKERQKEEKRKAEERRKKEQERKRIEAEKARLNPENWPTYRYMRKNTENDAFHNDISCLVCAIQNGISKTDISSDEKRDVADLQSCLQRGDILQSDIIRVRSTERGEICLELPMRVYIPYKPTDNSREVVLKTRIDNADWKNATIVQNIPKDAEKEICWLGTEINSFRSLDLVAVSKMKEQIIPVTPSGGSFTADLDKRATILVLPDCVQWPASLKLKIANNVEEMKKNRKDLDNVSVLSASYVLSCDSTMQKDSTLQMFFDSTRKLQMPNHMTAMRRSWKKLVDEMTLDSILEYMQQNDTISPSLCTDIKSGDEDVKTKSIKLLTYFATCSTKEFENLIDALRNTNQTYLAQILERAYDEKCIEQSSDFCTDLQDSDFDGDIKVVILGKEESDTTVVTKKELDIDESTMKIKLPGGRDSYSVVGLLTPRTMSEVDIRTAAHKIQTLSMQLSAALIFRQHKNNPTEVCVVCATEENVGKCIHDLEVRGFISGPKDFVTIGIGDGDRLKVTTVGNIEVVSENRNDLSFKFFSIKGSTEMTFTIKEKDKKAHLSRGQYVGRVQFFIEGQDHSSMTDSVIVYLPVGEDFQRYAPLVLDIKVVIIAKHVASVLAKQNQNPESFFKDLAGHSYRKLESRAKKESKTGSDSEKWEAFIVNWAAQRPRRENKVKEITNRMKRHFPHLVDGTMEFVSLYSEEYNGILSTRSLEKIAENIDSRWMDVADALKVGKTEILEIKDCFENKRDCAMRMLDEWRLSNKTVERGMSIVDDLMSALRTAGCDPSTVKLVEELMP